MKGFVPEMFDHPCCVNRGTDCRVIYWQDFLLADFPPSQGSTRKWQKSSWHQRFSFFETRCLKAQLFGAALRSWRETPLPPPTPWVTDWSPENSPKLKHRGVCFHLATRTPMRWFSNGWGRVALWWFKGEEAFGGSKREG